MKILLSILLVITTSICSFCQDTRGTRVIADKEIILNKTPVDSIRHDTTGWLGSIKSIPVADAIYKFVKGKIEKLDSNRINFDTTYQIKFSPVAFERRWVYSYSDQNYDYYNDSISIRGENGIANGKFWGRFDDSTGFFYPTLQRILNAYGSLDKRNVIQGNGNMLQWDSMGMLIRQRSYLSGGNDTIFSLNAGSRTTPYFIVRQSAGTEISGGSTNLNSGTLVVNDVNAQFNRPVRLGAGSEIQGIQNAIILRRSSPETPLYWIGTIITNDNTTGGVYPFPDSAGYVQLAIRFKNQTGYESDKFKFYADGSFWIPYTPYASAVSVDSLLAIKNGKVVKVLKSDIGGGGGGAVSSVFGRTGVVVAANGDYTWAQINKSTSSLADIATRNWSDLQNKPTTLGTAGITDAQPLDGDLTSIAAISSNGIPKRTGANTWSIATAGTDYSPGLNTSDNLVKVTASTGTVELKKSINTLTSSTSISVNLSLGPNYLLSLAHNASITISNEQQGDWFQLWVTQTSGSNTLSIDGQTINIDPAASATTWIGGTWNGSGWIFSTNLSPIIDLTTDVTGRLPYSNIAQGSALSVLGVSGNASANISSIAAASDNQVMRRSGSSIGFGAINLASSNAVTGTLPITNGGTGLSSLGTANQLLRVNSGATALEYFTPSWITASQVHGESIGRILLSNGSGGVVSDPGATIVSGLLSLGQSSYAGGSLKLVGDQAGSVTLNVRSSSSQDNYNITLPLVAGAAGETMVTNGSGNLEWKNLSSDDYTPTVTNVANMISSTGEGIIYTRVGNKVRMDGSFSVSLTSGSASTTIRISLPVSSDLQSNSDVRGIAGFVATGSSVGTLTVDASNDEIVINFTPTATSGMVSFSATYTVR